MRGGPKLRIRGTSLGPLRLARTDGCEALHAWRREAKPGSGKWRWNEGPSVFDLPPEHVSDTIRHFLLLAGAEPKAANARGLRRAYAQYIKRLAGGDVEASRQGLGHHNYVWTRQYTGETQQVQEQRWADLRRKADEEANR
jgi:hypothetical protein